MVFTTIIATVAATFTFAGYTTTTINAVNINYDQHVVQNSLSEMNETQRLLKEKALAETDPLKRQQKLAIADKLGQTHDNLSKLQSELVQKAVKKELLGLGKGLATGVKEVVGISDATADTAINLKNTYAGNSNSVDDSTIWRAIALSDDGIDVEIAKVKTRQLLKDTNKLNDDLAAMVKDFQDQEKAGSISSDNYEKKIGEIIEDNESLNNYVSDALAGLDVNAGMDNYTPDFKDGFDPEYSKQFIEDKIIDEEIITNPKDIVGVWKVYKYQGSEDLPFQKVPQRYNFYEDGSMTLDHDIANREYYYTYKLEANGKTGTFTHVGTKNRDSVESSTHCLEFNNGQVILGFGRPTCDVISEITEMVLVKVSDNPNEP